MNTRRHVCRILPLLALLSAGAFAGDKTLWISDDLNTTIYNITPEGTLITSFHSGSISEVAMGIGSEANTLWTTKEGSNLVIHMDKAGVTLSSFPGTKFDPAATTPEGVAVDFADNTLWVLDDSTERVYNTQKDGTLIASFPTTGFDANAISCQGIAADPDGTLWLTDNHSWKVYNVTKQGALIASFGVAAFDPLATNLQGISVDDVDRSLWLTDRDTHKIYNVSRAGALHSTIDATTFGSLNPTGVAVEEVPFVTFSGLIADIAEGLVAGELSAASAKKLTNTVKVAEKQFNKGHPWAAASVMGGFVTTVNDLLSVGLIDPDFARSLLTSAMIMIDDLDGP